MSVFNPLRTLEPNFLHGIAALHFPAFSKVHYVTKRLVWMGRRANKSVGVGPIAHNNLVDKVFEAGAIWTYHSNERHALTKASLHKAIEQGFIRNRQLKDDFASKRHCQLLAGAMSAFHP